MDPVPLPAYSESTYLPAAPPYAETSQSASGHVEARLHASLQDGNNSLNDDFQYECDLFHVRLDRSRWRLSRPAYGFNGVVEGTVRVKSKLTYTTQVTATLKGKIKISAMERGVVTGAIDTCILSEQVMLFSSCTHSGSPYGRELAFSIPIPAYVDGGTIKLPPTCHFSHPGVSCDVTYTLSIRVTRKGLRLHKTLKIPTSYLPKTRPSMPPVTEIPSPFNMVLSGIDQERVQAFKVSPSWACRRATVQEEVLPSVTVALPSPMCFTAGEGIPILLTITCHHAPMHNKLLIPNIDIQLIKKTTVWLKGGSNRMSSLGQYVSVRDMSISKACLCHVDEAREGVSQLHYRLKAGACGAESSWEVSKVVSASYHVQVVIKPPSMASKFLPFYRRNITVQLTTDHWGTWDTEMLAMDGLPVPALGLAQEPRDVFSCI